MGNCIGKSKKNRVSPSPVKEEAVVPKSRPDSTALFQVCVSPAEEIVKQIEDGQNPNVRKNGVAFTVDFKEGDFARMPSRLADRLNGVLTPEDVEKVQYTAEEREVMAGLLKADFLEERCKKARRDEMKAKVAQNKAVLNLQQAEFRARSALDKETPSLEERRRKVKEMADKARAKVAKKC